MTKKRSEIAYDQNIIEALRKLPNPIKDKRHNLIIYVRDDRSRSNETRFEHIAKNYHDLKVRDIEAIPNGIKNYIKFCKSAKLKDTYSYYINRKGEDKGFIKVVILKDMFDSTKAYLKTIFITYKIN